MPNHYLLFVVFGAIIAVMVWGRYRIELVAATGLFVALCLGLVSEDQVFTGFSHPAVLIVALAPIVSKAFQNSGALSPITRMLAKDGRPVSRHILVIGGVAAALSSFMNNITALSLLMPIDIQAAESAKRPAGWTLMPLAFATILGGSVTLIGTPPNIVASGFRQQALGTPYQMFDFTPVGFAVALAGVLFVGAIGWRLIPRRHEVVSRTVRVSEFTSELRVPESSRLVGRRIADLDEETKKADVVILRLRQSSGRRIPGRALFFRIQAGDVLTVEGSPGGISAFIKVFGLQPRAKDDAADAEMSEPVQREGEDESDIGAPIPDDEISIVEAVVPSDSSIALQTAEEVQLRSRHGVTLLGIAHGARTLHAALKSHPIEPGDMLLLGGRPADLDKAIDFFQLIPLSETSVTEIRIWKVLVTLGSFGAAVAAASFNILSFTTALAAAIIVYTATKIVSAREFYSQIDWPVVIMLACLLPLGMSFEAGGGTALVADGLIGLTDGHSAIIALLLLIVLTMFLSDILNNIATIVIAAPVALNIADKLSANPDSFLMGAAIAASCAFLTPIGHQNNLLIMGPGGYRFTDYWRMGLALKIVVLLVLVPMLLLVFPL
jgi:di/tricarboxylate transporter